jgi:SOS response regulatory protein OraA/RecX
VTVLVCEDGASASAEAQYLISRELWLWGKLQPGASLAEAAYREMEHNAAFSRAIARMKSILSYSGQSRRNLVTRLAQYGFEEDICEQAAEYAVEHGFVKEEAQAERSAEIYLHRKYWGKRRIAAELASRGYPEEVIRDAIEAIPEEDFRRALHTIIEKKYGMPPADPGERQKMVLSLLRLGYTGSEIKDAIAGF